MKKLVSCIEELKVRINEHRDTLSSDEFRTRVSLIDPLLRTLGWEVSDPDMVTLEYRTTTGRADYALLGKDGKPVAILEAKSLGKNLQGHLMQMLTYANSEGIKYAGLSNGDQWKLYSVFEAAELAKREKMDTSIEQNPTHHSLLQLLCLWRPNLCSGTVTEASTPITGLPNDPRLPLPNPTTDPSSQREWISLAKCTPRTEDLPITIRFWNGKKRELNRWSHLAREITKVLYTEKFLTEGNLPYSPGKGKNFIINTKPWYTDNTRFKHSRNRLPGTQIYMYTNKSPEGIKRSCIKLLEDFGKNPEADVQLKID